MNTRAVAGIAIIVVLLMALAMKASFVDAMRRAAALPTVYHDPRRGATCYRFPEGVSCVADATLFQAAR